MQNLRPWDTSPHSSPIKLRKTNSSSHVPYNSYARKFLDRLTMGLFEGIKSFDDIPTASEREMYIAANTTIFNELRHQKNDVPFNDVSIDLANATLRFRENADGIEIMMDDVTKLLPYETFQNLTNRLSRDVLDNTDPYGRAFSTYVENVVNYQDQFPVYHNAYTTGLDKSQPYLSAKKEHLITNFNDQVPIPGLDVNYQCRHYAALVAYYILKNPLGKIDWDRFQKDVIAETMPADIENIYNAFKANAANHFLIENDDLGKLIHAYFDMMKGTEETKALLVETANHAMAIRLRVKGTSESPIYVMNFYDPNITNASLRCETTDLSTFTSHTLQKYVNGWAAPENGNYQGYLNGMEPMVLVTECRLDNLTKPSINNSKKLSHCISDPLTPTHMHLLFIDNFYHDLVGLKSRLREIGEQSPERLVELLLAKSGDGDPALYLIMRNNLADSARAFSELIVELHDLIPEDKLAMLIAAKSSDGTPALYAATQLGCAEAVDAWCRMVPLISKRADCIDVITGKDAFGTPALCKAFSVGEIGVLQISNKLLLQVHDDDILAELILAETADKVTGLCYAMMDNRILSIRACKEWIEYIQDPTIRHELTVEIITKAAADLRDAMENGYTETVVAFGELFQLIPDKQIRQQCIDDLQLGTMREQFLQLTHALA